jgi:hypothetical protein
MRPRTVTFYDPCKWHKLNGWVSLGICRPTQGWGLIFLFDEVVSQNEIKWIGY